MYFNINKSMSEVVLTYEGNSIDPSKTYAWKFQAKLFK